MASSRPGSRQVSSFAEIIRSDDQAPGVAGVARHQVGQGLDGVAHAAARDLEILDDHARPAGHGETHHRQARGGRGGRVVLVGRTRGGDHVDAVGEAFRENAVDDGDVPAVDGVEGAAQQGPDHGVSPDPAAGTGAGPRAARPSRARPARSLSG